MCFSCHQINSDATMCEDSSPEKSMYIHEERTGPYAEGCGEEGANATPTWANYFKIVRFFHQKLSLYP